MFDGVSSELRSALSRMSGSMRGAACVPHDDRGLPEVMVLCS